jgi:hypothetical protein
MKKEIILLVIGASIGFIISILTLLITTLYQNYTDRKRASKICRIELKKIDNSLIPFISANKNMQLPDGAPINVISLDEILNFKMTNQLDVFLSLKDTLRSSVYLISFDLDRAESLRKLSIPLLNSADNATSLNMYATLYLEYLKSAKDKIDKLNIQLK